MDKLDKRTVTFIIQCEVEEHLDFRVGEKIKVFFEDELAKDYETLHIKKAIVFMGLTPEFEKMLGRLIEKAREQIDSREKGHE